LWRLDPKLAKLYSQLPPEVAAPIASLVRAASFERIGERIGPNRLLKYAFLYVKAEQITKGGVEAKAVAKDHERRANSNSLAKFMDSGTGIGRAKRRSDARARPPGNATSQRFARGCRETLAGVRRSRAK
jgi:hypothetical protein